MSMHPLHNFVVIKPTRKTETDSGLIIAETVAEFRQEGEIVAVGPGKKDEPMTVAIGDKVFFNKYSDATINQDGEEYVVVSEDQIFLIIK
jgi:chaperonin GroES